MTSSIKPRDPTKRAESQNCRLAYRRICGTCQFYKGSMYGANRALCTKTACYNGPRAAGCEQWTRRAAQ